MRNSLIKLIYDNKTLEKTTAVNVIISSNARPAMLCVTVHLHYGLTVLLLISN